jgi:hypothetical protein
MGSLGSWEAPALTRAHACAAAGGDPRGPNEAKIVRDVRVCGAGIGRNARRCVYGPVTLSSKKSGCCMRVNSTAKPFSM